MNLLHSLLSTSRGKPGMSLLVLVALIFSGCGGGGGTTTPPPPPAPTLTSIAISPTAAIIKKAATTSFTATGTYSDGSTANITSTVTWTSSLSSSVAAITAGVANGLAAGTTTITASYGGKTSPDAALTVITLNSIAITPATATVSTGSTTSFKATGTYSNGTTADITSQVSWTLLPTGVATIDLATGVATSIAAGGPTTITAMATGGATATGSASGTAALTVTNTALTSITISTTTPSVAKGVPATFTAMGNIGDVSGSVTWESSNLAVATINASGIATTLAEGNTNITTTAPITSNTATLTVTAPVLATLAITPTPASVAVGYTRQFTVSGTLTDGTAATASHWNPLTWASSVPGVAAIPVNGLATGGTTLGTTSITATAAGPIISNISVLTVALSQMGGARQGLPMTLTTAAVSTLAGTGAATPYSDGAGASATFSSPGSITTDGTNLYVADTVNHTIRKIVIATAAVTTLAGAATYSGNSDGTGSNARFNLPEGIATDGTNLYVADTTNNRIRQIVIATAAVTTLAGSGTQGSADGTGTAATFSAPRGITVDGSGNLYVADSGNNKIRKIVIATQAVSTLTPALVAPRGITTDGTNLYVADTANNLIRKIVIGSGLMTTLAGSGATGSADNVDGLLATFFSPRGITTDGTNLYVADTQSNKIRQIVITTTAVTTLAGSGTAGSDDLNGLSATFNLPHGITTDGTSLFVADNGGHKIRRIQ